MADNIQHRRQSDARLDSIERAITRIDASLLELSSAMISLARVEERLASSNDKVSKLENEVQELRGLVRSQTKAAADAGHIAAADHERSQWMERILWAVITGGTVGASYFNLFPHQS